MTPRFWAVIALVLMPVMAQAAVTPQALPDSKPAILLPDAAATATTQYDPAQGFPDRKGDLSGMVIVIPQQEAAAFGKGQGDDRQLDRVSRAEAGANLAIKLVFVGVKPDANGVANLTYDLEVLGPDGKIYGKSDYHGLMAMIGQVGEGNGSGAVYDNRENVVQMQFEPQDVPGTYTIKAVLHDRIAGIDLPMQTTVDLLPPRSAMPASSVPEPEATPTPTVADPPVATDAAATTKAATPQKTSRKHHRRHK